MKFRRLRNIIIELTSLLDVVMILIFAVMINYSDVAASSEESRDEAIREAESVEAEYDALSKEYDLAQARLNEYEHRNLSAELAEAQSRLDAYAYMDDLIVIVNVKRENRYDNKYRVLSYGIGSSGGFSTEPIAREDETEFNEQINVLKNFLYEEIKRADEDAQIYIVFTYNSENINDADFYILDDVLLEKAKMSDSVFYCKNDLYEVSDHG